MEKKEASGRQRSYKYLDVSLSLQCLLLTSFLLKIYWKAWGTMDGLREDENKKDGGVCRCPLKGKEHLDSLSYKNRSHVSASLHFSVLHCLIVLSCRVCLFLLSFHFPYNHLTGNSVCNINQIYTFPGYPIDPLYMEIQEIS